MEVAELDEVELFTRVFFQVFAIGSFIIYQALDASLPVDFLLRRFLLLYLFLFYVWARVHLKIREIRSSTDGEMIY